MWVWIICMLLAGLASSCSAPAATSPTPTPSPTPAPPPPPLPQVARLQLSGRVLDENGAPVAGTTVEVDYLAGAGVSNPPSTCPSVSPGPYCWLATHTNELGEYAVEFYPQSWPNHGLGYVYTVRDGYETDVQWVPVGISPAVLNLKTPSSRRLLAGESTVVSVGPSSSLCSDLEDLFALGSRCEIVLIESAPGTLRVEARAVSGDVVPSIFWYTTGNYGGFIEKGAGFISFLARGGMYRIMVGLPDGAPAQQFTVTTSLK